MKKIVFMLVILAAFGQGTLLFAQQESRFPESEYYYFNIPIEKIYSHRLGYMVIYRKGAHEMARTFIPVEWFNTIGGRGEIVGLRAGTEWPSMVVYYHNGEFSHVRLRLRINRAHESWGVIPLNVNVDDQFRDIEEIQLEF